MLICAIVFLVVIFFIKNKTLFKNKENKFGQEAGLIYGDETLEGLVNKDTDGDGVLDWEEGLWGTDPTKKDTNDDGTPDNVEIAKMKFASGEGGGELSLESDASPNGTETLTETDKFSREFFSTVATLNQTGAVDQETADKLGESLSAQIQNTVPKKVFLLSDFKIIKDDSMQAIKNYNNVLNTLYTQKSATTTRPVMNILQDFVIDENNVDTSVLPELDPTIAEMKEKMDGMLKMTVPQSLASLHLDIINGFQRLLENLNNLKLYDADTIVALTAINQYETNANLLIEAMTNLENQIKKN